MGGDSKENLTCYACWFFYFFQLFKASFMAAGVYNDPEMGVIQNENLTCYACWFFYFFQLFKARFKRWVKIKKPQLSLRFSFVGAAGFEPATSWSQTRRDDRTTLRPEH
jgi:hypothetical protein